MKITEGYMPYLGYKTYYRIAGECSGNKKPLILLHGGPGSTHNYFEVLDRLADEGRAIISYDQLGCGNSYVEGHSELWCSKTWMNELIELRKYLGLNELHLLGQSWGGMLSIEYLCDHKPEGIKSVILSSTHPSSKLWAHEQHRMIKFMSQEDQDAIAKAEATGNFDDPAYLAANERFMLLHAAGVPKDTDPECLRRGYPLSVFEQAVHSLHAIGVQIITHVILFLPGESEADMLATIHYLNALPIDGIKLQLLHVLKHTDLADFYRQEPFYIPDMNSYFHLLGKCIASLRPDIVIHRLTGDGPKSLLIAPLWTGNKRLVLNQMQRYLKEQNLWQGKEYTTF